MAKVGQRPQDFGVGRLFWLTSEAIVAAELESERIVLWNPAAERLLGYTAAEALGMRLEVLVPGSLRDDHLAGLRHYRESGDAVLVGAGPIHVPAVSRSGEVRDIALSLTDVSTNATNRVVLAVIRDVTDERRAERDLQAANDAMRSFVAAASHDLRTPLAAVVGYAQLLADPEVGTGDERRDFLGVIVRNATHACRLVDDLMTLSHIQSGVVATRRQMVSVGVAARRAKDAAFSDASITIDDALVVRADPDHLERILVNYLTNAARYGAPPVEVTAYRHDGFVEIRVCDAGGGVPETFLDRLFTSFARAEPSVGEGTGLGLSIVKGLAEANGGSAFYEPPGLRAGCFGVALPASDTE